MKVFLKISIIFIFIFWILSFDFSGNGSKSPIYGVSFSRFHTDELGLDWKETYLAILNDLGVRNFRFSAHWPITEPEEGQFNFDELDFQVDKASEKNASAILAVGRRLPGWPECHEPTWLKQQITNYQSQEEQTKYKQERILEYIEAVVNRYKNYANIKYWQVENEPFLTFFSRSTCGELDKDFLQKEIDLVKKLDPSRPILMTDSGEFGSWFQAYKRGDVFGTSLYLYIWNKRFDLPLRYPITPGFFNIKKNIVGLLLGPRPIIAIEISSEPWLLQPIKNTPLDIQLDRMGIDKFNEMIEFSKKADFDTMYLWGAEWWYYLKTEQGYSEHWDRAVDLFR